jgi:hypothetical protein
LANFLFLNFTNFLPFFVEAILLLIALTPGSEELQKLVAFENAFDFIFSLIEAEGSMSHGSEVVEDCLSLLANLLRLNASNQSHFRETGCAKKLTKLLADANQEQETDEPIPQWTIARRDKNIWGLLVILQLFLVKGGIVTPANQVAFWNTGVMEQVLSVAFSQRFSVKVTSKVGPEYRGLSTMRMLTFKGTGSVCRLDSREFILAREIRRH